MKLITLLLFALCLQVSARSYSQKITISGKNISLDQVFKIIEKQTNYVFFFDEEGLRQAKPITINIKKATLTEALTLCFDGQPLGYNIVGNTIVISRKNQFAEVKKL
ncbi:MAG TPA: STN domain-containing protein, partial [Agriterribacter sp.]|nr:STN domain-containing protein [Agriterribacter sp.]